VLRTDYPFFVLAALTGQLCFLALSLTRLTHCRLPVHHLIKAIELPIIVKQCRTDQISKGDMILDITQTIPTDETEVTEPSGKTIKSFIAN